MTRRRRDRRTPPIGRRKIGIILVGLTLLFGVAWYFSDRMGEWVNPPPPPVYMSPPPPEQQLVTGKGSAQFSIYAPQYPDAEIENASRFTDPDSGLTMVTMHTPDDLPTVSEFYREALAEKGFRPKLKSDGNGLTIMGERPSAGLHVLISLKPKSDGGTLIELTDSSTLSSSQTK